MNYTYKYPRPALTVDCLIFKKYPEFQLLLIQRKYPPFENEWALPGGFVEIEEDLKEAALRELEEETGLKGLKLEQLHTFGKPGRDPRGRVISVAFWGQSFNETKAVAGDDAKKAKWFPISQLPRLAFDHEDILKFGMMHIAELQNKVP